MSDQAGGRNVTSLREELLQGLIGESTYWTDSAEEALDAYTEALVAERDRYRAALERIRDEIVPYPYQSQHLKDMAREALTHP